MRFGSKRDGWLTIMIYACIAALVFAGLSPFIVGGISIIGGAILFIVSIGVAMFMAWLWFAVAYELREQELFIKFGPFKKSMTYSSVSKAMPIRSWISSAATSYHRVEIRYNKYDIIHISPKERQLFLQELKQRCPHASIETNSEQS